MTDTVIPRPSRFRPLRQRNFLLLWQGQLVSVAGGELTTIAIALYVSQVLSSTTLMGLILMTYALPGVLLGPIAGVIVDQHPRKRVIIACDLANGTALLMLTLCFALALPQEATVTMLFGVAVVVGTANCFFGPALSAIIPDTVPPPELVAANALNSSTRELAVIGGQAVGGVLYAALGAKLIFLFDSLSYFFSAWMTSLLRLNAFSEHAPKAARPPFLVLLKEGFRYVANDRGLRLVFIAAAAMNFLVRPFFVLLPFFVARRLHAEESWYGYLLAAISVGALSGFWLASRTTVQGERKGAIMALSWIFFSSGLLALGFTTSVVLAVALNLIVGMSMGYFNVSLAAVLQTAVPPQLRGRVFSLLRTIAMALTPVAMAASGYVAELLGGDIALIYVSSGLALLAFSVAFALMPDFRRYLSTSRAAVDTGS